MAVLAWLRLLLSLEGTEEEETSMKIKGNGGWLWRTS